MKCRLHKYPASPGHFFAGYLLSSAIFHRLERGNGENETRRKDLHLG
jgi:hypothetical protein